MAQQEASPVSRSRWIGRWLAVMVGIAAAGLLVRHLTDLQHFAILVRQAQPLWLLVGLGLQVSTYVMVALSWKLVLLRAGLRRKLHVLLPVSISKLFADQALPGAGLGGHVLLVDRLMALGAPRGAAAATLLISMIGYYLAYMVLALAMLLVLWLHHRATPLLSGLVTTFLLVALAIPLLALWLRHRGSQPLPPWLERVGPVRSILTTIGEAPVDLVGDRRLLVRVSLLNGGVFLADAATLAVCMRALGMAWDPATAFLALMAGSIAATLAPIPLGLGSFEASSTAMMASLGVPVEAALTATLLLRGLTLWLPLLPGLVLMRTGWHGKGERQ